MNEASRNRTMSSTPRHLIASLLMCCLTLAGAASLNRAQAELLAGAAKVDIKDYDAGPVNDPLYVKALALRGSGEVLILITVDAVAIGGIGRIGDAFLPDLRTRLERELGIPPTRVLVNASHCHGVVRMDLDELAVVAVQQAWNRMTPVKVGAGAGYEDRIMENRRYLLRDGRQTDSRHAYAMPPDEDVAAVGPVDPEIGVLRLDRSDGAPLAVVYNFACHPIQGAPGGGNTADLTGFASQVIEENAGDGALALFLQGCAGDINPAFYKAVDHPRDAEPLGNLLGLSTLRAWRQVETREDPPLKVLHETVALPRANFAGRIAALEAEQDRLLHSLQGTSLNLKTFLPLIVKYRLAPEFPSAYAHRYLHEEQLGREDLQRLDAENRANLDRYIDNIHIMEELTRLQTNLALLRKHQARNTAADSTSIEAEILGVRIGDFVLVTFPGELTVEIGLSIKEASPHAHTFVAGYTNGYLYYAPTREQACNTGSAQEDSDCLLAPEWQQIFEDKATEFLEQL